MTDDRDPMPLVAEAIGLGNSGDRPGARTLLEQSWASVGIHGDPFFRLAISHAMADVQDDLHAELAWDERALAAADELTHERLVEGGVHQPVGALYPSLHLNLGDVHRRLGNIEQAKVHVRLGRAALVELSMDGYGQMVREGLDRLAARLDSEA